MANPVDAFRRLDFIKCARSDPVGSKRPENLINILALGRRWPAAQ
jgi:hypothetical protein